MLQRTMLKLRTTIELMRRILLISASIVVGLLYLLALAITYRVNLRLWRAVLNLERNRMRRSGKARITGGRAVDSMGWALEVETIPELVERGASWEEAVQGFTALMKPSHVSIGCRDLIWMYLERSRWDEALAAATWLEDQMEKALLRDEKIDIPTALRLRREHMQLRQSAASTQDDVFAAYRKASRYDRGQVRSLVDARTLVAALQWVTRRKKTRDKVTKIAANRPVRKGKHPMKKVTLSELPEYLGATAKWAAEIRYAADDLHYSAKYGFNSVRKRYGG